MNANRTSLLGLLAASALLAGCVTQSPPPRLTYLAVERPEGMIEAKKHMAEVTTKRGGFYVLNHGFRPAPDVGAYVQDAEKRADVPVLRNADVELAVPFAFDILFFGFQFGNDVTRANH